MNIYNILIGLSLIIILSYLFDIIVKKFKVPSVYMLLITGIGLRLIAGAYQIKFTDTQKYLEIFGIIGLVLIILQGALNLTLSRDKLPVIRKSLFAAFGIFIGTSLAIALLLHLWTGLSYRSCWVNAIPLSIISSAITVSGIRSLSDEKKEFLTYESTFSDIIGIMVFNFAIQHSSFGIVPLASFSFDLVLVSIISLISCIILLFFISKTGSHVKFFLIIAFLILAFSVGKLMNLSTMLLILMFGLFINNSEQLVKGRLHKFLSVPKLKDELGLLKLITAESAFLIRTFFFVLFGFSIDFTHWTGAEVPVIAGMICITIVLARYIHLKFVTRQGIFPQLLIAPRGLITIVLFYSIPAEHYIGTVTEVVLLAIIVATGLLMTMALLRTPSPAVSGDEKELL